MLFIIGLGNPGNQYLKTRHNIGFMLLDEIASTHPFSSFASQRIKAQAATGELAGVKTHLIKPTTYMNLSGKAVIPLMQFYKPERDQILVVHDDLELATGKVRMKFGGGNGGHNGLKSIDNSIGKDYWRLRVGIDHPGDPNLVSSYVLGQFTPDEAAVLDQLMQAMARNIPTLIQGGCFSNDQFSTFSNAIK